MLTILLDHDRIQIGERFALTFQRTLRLPDDGRVYLLPPTLGAFPVRWVADYPGRVPASWQAQNGMFFPMYQREAMWLAFEAASWKPNAVKIAVGRINVLTGEPFDEGLHDDPQDYIVCPDQPWLDGVKVGEGIIRQFVAMPLGQGVTIEGQLTGREQFGGIQLRLYEPLPGLFPDQPPPPPPASTRGWAMPAGGPMYLQASPPQEMGLAAGGQMSQKVYPDTHGLAVWDQSEYGELFIYIVNSLQYQQITGEPPPPTPVSAQTYTQYGFPWFSLYDEELGDLAASQTLAEVQSLGKIAPGEEDDSVDVQPEQIKKITRRSNEPSRLCQSDNNSYS